MPHQTFSLVVIPLVAVLCASAVNAQSPEDEAAIRAVIVEMTHAFNGHDEKAAVRMYLPDADLVTVRGDRFQGAAQMEAGLAAIFNARAQDATLRTLDLSIRFVQPGLALAHVTNELSGLVAADGQQLPAQREISLRVFVERDGAWRLAAFHNTIVRPFEAPAATR